MDIIFSADVDMMGSIVPPWTIRPPLIHIWGAKAYQFRTNKMKTRGREPTPTPPPTPAPPEEGRGRENVRAELVTVSFSRFRVFFILWENVYTI
jgi:hypothetical protein